MIKRSEIDINEKKISQDLDIRDFLKIFNRNKKIFFISTLVFSIIFSIFYTSKKEVFVGRQLIYVNDNQNIDNLLLRGALEKSNLEDINLNTLEFVKYCQKNYSVNDVYQIINSQELKVNNLNVNVIRNSNMIELVIRSNLESQIKKDFKLIIKKYNNYFVDIFDRCKSNKLDQFVNNINNINLLNENNNSEVIDINQKKSLISKLEKQIIYLNGETYDSNAIEIIPGISISLSNDEYLSIKLLRSIVFALILSSLIMFINEFKSDYIYDKKVLKQYFNFAFFGYLSNTEINLNNNLLMEKIGKEILSGELNDLKFLLINNKNRFLKTKDIFNNGFKSSFISIYDITKLKDQDKVVLIIRFKDLNEKDLFRYLNQIRNKHHLILGWFILDN